MAGFACTRRPAYRLAALATLSILLVSGCTSAKTGKGIADGDEAAAYVSAKFAENLRSLSDDLARYEPRKSRLRHHIELDDKTSHKTYTAIQLGSPPDRYVKAQLSNNPSEYLVTFHPARSKVKYLLLGPHYGSLAPTPWVSMPYSGWNRGPCAWLGYETACRMLGTVADAAQRGNAAKKATSLSDGSVKLQAEVTLRDFLKNKVIVFPDNLASRITSEMKAEPIKTMVRLDPDGGLRRITMNATITGGGHRLRIQLEYQVLEPPTKSDLPDAPAKDKVTKLEGEAAVDDFYRRLNEL